MAFFMSSCGNFPNWLNLCHDNLRQHVKLNSNIPPRNLRFASWIGLMFQRKFMLLVPKKRKQALPSILAANMRNFSYFSVFKRTEHRNWRKVRNKTVSEGHSLKLLCDHVISVPQATIRFVS